MSPDLRFVHLPRQQPTGFSDHQQKSRTDHTLPVVATRTVTSPRPHANCRSAVTSAAIGRPSASSRFPAVIVAVWVKYRSASRLPIRQCNLDLVDTRAVFAVGASSSLLREVVL